MSHLQSFWNTTSYMYIHYGRVDIRLGNNNVQPLFTTLKNRGVFILQQVWMHFDGGDPGTSIGANLQISKNSTIFADPERLSYVTSPITPLRLYTAFTDNFTYPTIAPQVQPETICYIRNSATSNVNSTSCLCTFILKGYYELAV